MKTKLLTAVLALAVAGFLRAQEQTTFEPGFDLDIYWIGRDMDHLPELVEGQTPNIDMKVLFIDMKGPDEGADFAHQFVTEIRARLIPEVAGLYDFRLTSDDGSILTVDGKVVVDHDGLHGAEARVGSIHLEARPCEILLRHFENQGDWVLKLEWRRPGQKSFELLDSRYCSTPAGVVRVTSPGAKRIRKRIHARAEGDGRPLVSLHPGYRLVNLRPLGFRPRVGGLDMLPGGRLVLCCWEPDGGVYILDGVLKDDPKKRRVKRIASGLAEPLGIKVVGKRLFVLQKQELTELIDHDGDEIIDEYRCVSDGWAVTANFHEFAFGLVEKDGWLYFNLAIAIDPGGRSTSPQVPGRGTCVRVHMDSGAMETVAWGLRTPNGIGRGPGGEIFLTDNQGDWLPSNKLLHLKMGAFYGQRSALPQGWQERPVTPPAVWLPQNEIGNSPSEPALFPTGPFMGQMALGDVTHGGIKRVALEQVDGVYQGAVFRFTQGLEAGVNRLKILPDGSLIAGGIGSSGNWGQKGKLWYGLQRMVPDGQKTFEMHGLRAARNGFHIDFTEKLAYGMGMTKEEYEVHSFRYEPTAAYGGPKVDERREVVRDVYVWKNRRRVFLTLGDLEPGRIYALRLSRHLRSEEHRALWSTQAWYTLNALPKRAMNMPAKDVMKPPHNLLSNREKKDGWKLLFDGHSVEHFRGFKKDTFPQKGWVVQNGELVHLAGAGGGDIITRAMYGDFEFQCEWRVAEGANSGIMYRVTEEGHSTWVSGPEMQILDDDRHPDGENPTHRAGALYDFLPCAKPAWRPVGEWNHARIVVRDDHVQHWLNGILVVQYRWSRGWFREQIKKSKFAASPLFARAPRGHIALQDHGDHVRYRNIKIRPLN